MQNNDIQLAVEALSAHNIISATRIVGNWYQCKCPFHSNGNENHPSCGILLHTEYRNNIRYPAGMFHCFTCGYTGEFVDSINKIFTIYNLGSTGSEWLAKALPNIDWGEDAEFDSLVPSGLMDNVINKYAITQLQAQLGQTQSYVSEEELAGYRYTVPYMYERKLTDPIIEEYDIGVDMKWIPPGRKKPVPCITFPVRDKEGRTLFLCRRSIQGKLYNYPEGVNKPVYGIDRVPYGCKSLIICESCINALTARVYGYNAVALLGTGNAYQIQQLKELGIHEFVLCMDGDEAGRRATNKLKKALKEIGLTWVVEMPDGKDLNDCTKEEFQKLYAERT